MSAPEGTHFVVRLGSRELTHERSTGVVAMEIEDAEDCVGEAVITLDPHQHDPPALGVAMEVEIDGVAVFHGFVSGWRWQMRDGLTRLAVVGSDVRGRLAASLRTRTFEGVDERAAVRRVLDEAAVPVGGVCALGPASAHLWQREESDLAFVTRLAARRGACVRVREGEVHVEPARRPEAAITVEADDVLGIELEASLLGQGEAYVARAWSEDQARVVEVRASEDDLRGSGSGLTALALASRARMGVVERSDVPSGLASDVAAAAVCALRERAGRLVEGEVVVRGRAAVSAGRDVALRGVPAPLQIQGWVRRVRHELSPGAPFLTSMWICGDRLPV